MESHPVPQNVTTFEFKLIGDMTLKQFAYLALGCGIAYLIFVFIFPLNAVIALPIIALSAGLGAAFAFLPIADRPLDYWLKAYLRAVYSPTKRSWQNSHFKLTQNDMLFKNRLQSFLKKTQPPSAVEAPKTTPIINEDTRNPIVGVSSLDRTSSDFGKPATLQSGFYRDKNLTRLKVGPTPIISTLPPQQPTTPTEQNTPSNQKLAELVELAKEAQKMQAKISSLNQEQGPSDTKPLAEAEKFKQYHQSLDILSQQLDRVSQQIQKEDKNITVVQPVKKAVVSSVQKPSAIPTLTTFPNVINGIVTDTQGNYIEGVIVIIHNKDGLPVRALKTNKLGQFTGATPLPSSEYQITLEKEGLEFGDVAITLNDQVLRPLQITAQKGGV